MNPRYASVLALLAVLDKGRSLTDALDTTLEKVNPRDRSLSQAICYGVMRELPRLEFQLGQLLDKPLKNKDVDLNILLLSGLFQIFSMRIPDHAAVSENVALVKLLKKDWARGLVNAILRNAIRQKDQLISSADSIPVALYRHPQWWIERIRQAWPQHWQSILDANNQAPPMMLRVNLHRISREAYLQKLAQQALQARLLAHTDSGLLLDRACPVEELPGFAEGEVSVQDGAAQLVAHCLSPLAGERILDACAAPGGKTAHLLELAPELAELTAIDIDPGRTARIRETLARLQLNARVLAADAAQPSDWWDGVPFDRILLDAPCSATGVIRRHPDIKLLRRASDIDDLGALQGAILSALWPLLAPGGRLLYVTCSVLAAENNGVVQGFLEANDNAVEDIVLPNNNIRDLMRRKACGYQILPGTAEMDGFYYACLVKKVS